MGKSKEAAKSDIKQYVQKIGGAWSSWYVGITADPEQRLFNDHNVDRKGAWIYVPCDSADVARDVEAYFIDILGTKGGGGGGDNASKFVYAYTITSSTKE